MITRTVNEDKLQKDLQQLIEAGGFSKKYAVLATKTAAGVIDDEARKKYKNAQYTYGSSETHLKGTMLTQAGKKIYTPRARFRDWAGAKSSIKFQAKKQQKTQFWHRTMVRRINNGRGNPSTLAHLVEDGAVNIKARRKNYAWNLRRWAFRSKQREALMVLEDGLAYAVSQATTGTKMGLVKFRKAVRP